MKTIGVRAEVSLGSHVIHSTTKNTIVFRHYEHPKGAWQSLEIAEPVPKRKRRISAPRNDRGEKIALTLSCPAMTGGVEKNGVDLVVCRWFRKITLSLQDQRL